MTELDASTPVGEIAAHHPLATRVFARHGIDFCCGGGLPLTDACAWQGLEPDEVLAQIRQELASSQDPGERWDEAPVEDLVRHIVHAYHEPLREELPRLESMARKVVQVHGEKDPERLAELLRVFLSLQGELGDHMEREETALFPEILAHGEQAIVPIDPFVDDHSEAGRALERIRELTDGYRVPEAACNTWRALWHGLEALELAMHHHVHLENNVLFRRVISA